MELNSLFWCDSLWYTEEFMVDSMTARWRKGNTNKHGDHSCHVIRNFLHKVTNICGCVQAVGEGRHQNRPELSSYVGKQCRCLCKLLAGWSEVSCQEQKDSPQVKQQTAERRACRAAESRTRPDRTNGNMLCSKDDRDLYTQTAGAAAGWEKDTQAGNKDIMEWSIYYCRLDLCQFIRAMRQADVWSQAPGVWASWHHILTQSWRGVLSLFVSSSFFIFIKNFFVLKCVEIK